MRKTLLYTSVLMLLIVTGALMATQRGCSSPFAFKLQFRITNMTGKDVAVTSAHTRQTTSIPNQAAAVVPHGHGDITVRQRDGKTWVYKDVSRMSLEGTSYAIIKRYAIPFGGGTSTVNLVLDKDGWLHVVPPDAKDVDIGQLKQPEGFPLKPNVAEVTKESTEPSSGEGRDARK